MTSAGKSEAEGQQLWTAEQDALNAGAEAAEIVIRAQLQAGMPIDKIERSAERVIAGWFDHPTPISAVFYEGYAEVAETYVGAAREFDLERGPREELADDI